jgi:hypothetical protein
LAVGQRASVEGIDIDADGFADEVTMLWQKLGGADDNLFIRNIAVDSLAPDTEAELPLDYDNFSPGSPPELFQHAVGLGASWRVSGPSSRDVFYLPFSTSAIGICQPQ